MNHHKIYAIIVARQGSTRLPNKALIELEGKPLIGHIVDRARASKYISGVVIATSTNIEDSSIERYGNFINVPVFRGSPEDVLDRIYNASINIDASAFIEIGGDCPFVCPELIDKGIETYFENDHADMVSNALVSPFTYPVGYDFILITKKALEIAHQSAILSSERFQPFQYIIKHPKLFKVCSFFSEKNFNHWRWTLDYPEDLQFVKTAYANLYKINPFFGFKEIYELIKKDNSITSINQMHAERVQENTAWFTGSYVKEVHNDVKVLLQKAYILESARQYTDLPVLYENIQVLIKDLEKRSIAKSTHA